MLDEEIWYRFDYILSSNISIGVCADIIYNIPDINITLSKYPVIKHTNKGVWLNVYGTKRFVLNDSVKKFACPSKYLAKKSFLARKNRQVSILEKKLLIIKEAILKIKQMDIEK